ncbi:hypothetical protein COL48_08755 [Bacillus toyonensis]|uniref:hypothetical protein n=1 Tax=Bacillus toyonensis TaxID=155322 RepID=UPI000BF641B5|nr:hypothetical protein [Bacillus toyonensis]PFY33382.1 hypothetical protein COL48_08755 [Bacillus toyonensis]PHB35381.1 hypothetical protein COE86_12530 [Bacillus toyonensis]QWI03707.1 hypothetical protein EXW54_02890 [Bacillus toyonensis]HDR7385748.1 hypothetical protein [Bacillus toyonensis]
MLPTKEQLIQHLSDKMTNQDIAKIYDITFQKVIQLIKKYKIDPNELRKVNKFIVYEHWLNNEVVYVGSGVWYRCRRIYNRRNSVHRQLMQENNIDYKIVGEFDKREIAREFEVRLIKNYKQLGQAKFNKQVN